MKSSALLLLLVASLNVGAQNSAVQDRQDFRHRD